jgi:hypothetical protein
VTRQSCDDAEEQIHITDDASKDVQVVLLRIPLGRTGYTARGWCDDARGGAETSGEARASSVGALPISNH